MEKVNNLAELRKLVGELTVDKCFKEYLQEQKKEKTMTMKPDEMHEFIDHLGRVEMFDELEECKKTGKSSRYFKAVVVTLKTMGYNAEWVNKTFRRAMYKKYKY